MPLTELSLLSQKELNILEFVKHEIVIKSTGTRRYIHNRRKVIGKEIEILSGKQGTRFFVATMKDLWGNRSVRIMSNDVNGVQTGIIIDIKDAENFIKNLYDYTKKHN